MVWTFAALLLVVAPALDLGWTEPTLDESKGGRCQVHANPVVTLEPVSTVVDLAVELLAPLDPLTRLPFIDSSIFVPPRP